MRKKIFKWWLILTVLVLGIMPFSPAEGKDTKQETETRGPGKVEKAIKCKKCKKLLNGYLCKNCKKLSTQDKSEPKDQAKYRFSEEEVTFNTCPTCGEKKLIATKLLDKQNCCIFCKGEAKLIDVRMEKIYACLDHPEENLFRPGKCPQCNKKLIVKYLKRSEIFRLHRCPNDQCNYTSLQALQSGKCPLCKTTMAQDNTWKDITEASLWHLSQEDVDKAVKKGTDFLWGLYEQTGFSKRVQEAQKNPPGIFEEVLDAALVLYTLAHCGYSKVDSRMQEEIQCLLATPLDKLRYNPSMMPIDLSIYTIAWAMMALEALDRKEYHWRIAEMAQFMIDSQDKQRGWGFPRPKPVRRDAEKLSPTPTKKKKMKAIITGDTIEGTGTTREGTKIEEQTIIKKGKTRNPGLHPNIISTQFAILGLRAAERAGVVIPQETWEDAEAYLIKQQGRDGGWGFDKPIRSIGGTTVGGLCALIICKYYLKKDYKNDPDIKKGIEWIAKKFTVTENPNLNLTRMAMFEAMYFYYLFSLERFSVIGDHESIEGIEIYPILARRIVLMQQETGCWNAWASARERKKDETISGGMMMAHPIEDTCLALLCLKQAIVDLPVPIDEIFNALIEGTEKEIVSEDKQKAKETGDNKEEQKEK